MATGLQPHILHPAVKHCLKIRFQLSKHFHINQLCSFPPLLNSDIVTPPQTDTEFQKQSSIFFLGGGVLFVKGTLVSCEALQKGYNIHFSKHFRLPYMPANSDTDDKHKRLNKGGVGTGAKRTTQLCCLI